MIAHGMFHHGGGGSGGGGLGGAPDAVVEFGVRFTCPVLVPDTDEGTEVVVRGSVEKVEDGLAYIEVTAACGGEKVLAQARAIVRQ